MRNNRAASGALIRPARNAAKSVALSGNSRGLGIVHGPTFEGAFAADSAPAVTFEQLRTAAVTSRPPHASAVRSVTAIAGLSSADVV